MTIAEYALKVARGEIPNPSPYAAQTGYCLNQARSIVDAALGINS